MDMTLRANTVAVAGATSTARRTTYGNTSNVRPIAAVIRKARELWPKKVAAELAERAGVSVRSAENYLAGDRDMNGNALARLIRSDDGPAFIEALIADLPPSRQKRWRKTFEQAAERAALRRRLEELDSEKLGLTD